MKKKRKLEQECQVALYRPISSDFKEAQDKSIQLEKKLEEAEDGILLVQTELRLREDPPTKADHHKGTLENVSTATFT